ncbi:MAG: heme lyase CcmF/NrfE family subunit [SAR86 cluster bacterium]|nr:heme lyase CcmF/NrfE family subunit [SAR86 cluster bacterium]
MIPEIGHIFLISALVFSLAGSLIPVYGIIKKDELLISTYKSLLLATSVFTFLSFLILIYSFYVDDFSLLYVAMNSNTNLPFYYKLTATWGAHEGSLILWISILCLWSVFYLFKSKAQGELFRCMTIIVLCQIIFSFLAFTIFTSNPFERILPISPLEGIELNPLLQDFAFTIHPPLLYAGYSGLSIPFSMAIASMLIGYKSTLWAGLIRPWALLSSAFLTLGICLGSWWAYYELGWGGWWFWDPVENAAFVPWLISVALFHSLIVTHNKGVFSRWSLLLTILAFASCLLGTFLVRSGVLTSVHSFALDPERGVFILLIFAYFILSSLLIFAFKNKSEGREKSYSFLSKEFGLLLNNLLLVILALSIMFGTLFPMIYEAFTGGKQISVGAPYYEILILPFAIGLALLQGLAMYLSWTKISDTSFITRIILESIIAFILFYLLVYLFFGKVTSGAFIAGILFCWIISGNLVDPFLRNLGFSRLKKIVLHRMGLIFSHLGTAVLVIGIGMVTSYSLQNEVKLSKNDDYVLGGYEFKLKDVNISEKQNYETERAVIEMKDLSSTQRTFLITEKRFYPSAKQATSEAAIKPGFFQDVYITLGDNLGKGTWSFRIQIKHFVRWIWLGAILISLGMIISSIKQFKVKN